MAGAARMMGGLSPPDAIAQKVRFPDVDDPDEFRFALGAICQVMRDRAWKLEAVALGELKNLIPDRQLAWPDVT